MAIDITPQTDQNTEVSIGDELTLTWTQNAQLANDQDLTLVIQPHGETEETYDGSDFREVDNGDGTWTYEYDHIIKSTYTEGRWELDSNQGHAADRWKLRANE